MIIDLHTYEPEDDIRGDVCVVGAGPAGITIALELAAHGIDVVLVEGGGLHYEDASQALYNGGVAGHEHTDVLATRLRYFGGTSGHWTGRCAPLDEIDFEAREGVPHSGWPITRSELDPFYQVAQGYLELGPFRYELSQWQSQLDGAVPLALDKASVESVVYQQSPPTRFGEIYREPIEKARHIRCFLHANLVDIRLAEGSDSVSHIAVSTLEGKRRDVHARHFVLACGGIENARILLNCNRQRDKGLGNENDLVGRYFMDHLNVDTSAIVFADETLDLDLYTGFQRVDGSVLSIGLRIAPETMRREHLLNNAAFLSVSFENEAFSNDFRNHGWLSFSTMVKAFARGQMPERLTENYCNAVEDVGAVTTGVYRHVMRRVVPPGKALAATLGQDAEQAPNPDSRVRLGEDVDPFGWRRVVLDWRVSRTDMESLRRTHEMIGAAVGAAGIGRMRLGFGEPPSAENVYTAYHHMGTTRMHDDPRQGVVDRNCRVHSLRNLYMAGSSVFTTAGTANPTLTIVALAARLAARLATSLRS